MKQDDHCTGHLGLRKGGESDCSHLCSHASEAGFLNSKMMDWKGQLSYGEETRQSTRSCTEGRKGGHASHLGLKGL